MFDYDLSIEETECHIAKYGAIWSSAREVISIHVTCIVKYVWPGIVILSMQDLEYYTTCAFVQISYLKKTSSRISMDFCKCDYVAIVYVYIFSNVFFIYCSSPYIYSETTCYTRPRCYIGRLLRLQHIEETNIFKPISPTL